MFASALATYTATLVIATGVAAQEFPSSNVGDFLPSVTAMNQKLKNDGVEITYAFLPKAGTLAILSGNPEGKSGATVVGSVDLAAGDHREVKVPLTSAPKAGSRLWAQVEQGKSGKPFAGSDERAEQSFKVL
jgi:hypothetical protein